MGSGMEERERERERESEREREREGAREKASEMVSMTSSNNWNKPDVNKTESCKKMSRHQENRKSCPKNQMIT